MANITVLPPIHTDFESAHIIHDYPYGRLRTDMKIWIETKKNKGQRVVSCTLNPKTGEWNKPHAGTYHLVCVLFIDHDDKDHVKNDAIGEYDTSESGDFLTKYESGIPSYQAGQLRIFNALHIAQNETGLRFYGATLEERGKIWARAKEILTESGHGDLVNKIRQ